MANRLSWGISPDPEEQEELRIQNLRAQGRRRAEEALALDAEMDARAQALARRRRALESSPEFQEFRESQRRRAEAEEFQSVFVYEFPKASFPVTAEGPYTPGPLEDGFDANPEAVSAAFQIAVSTLRPGEEAQLARLMGDQTPQPVSEYEDTSALSFEQRLGIILTNLPDIQDVLAETDGDLEVIREKYPRIYDILRPGFLDEGTPESRRAEAERQLGNELLRAAWKEGFSRKPQGVLSKRAMAVRIANTTGADPDIIYDNFDELQESIEAANFDPEILRRENPALWLAFANNVRTGSIGLHDPDYLRSPGLLRKSIRTVVDPLLGLSGRAVEGTGVVLNFADFVLTEVPSHLLTWTAENLMPRRLRESYRALTLEQRLEHRRLDKQGITSILLGTPWVLRQLGEGAEGLGQTLLDLRSVRTLYDVERSMPQGDLFRPSTWSLGEDPNFWGFLNLTAEGFGSLVPMLIGGGTGAVGRAGALATRATGALTRRGVARWASRTVGGAIRHAPMSAINAAQVGGYALMDIDSTLESLKSEPGGLYEHIPAYKKLVDSGVSPEVAEEAVRHDAVWATVPLAAGVGAVGGHLTSLFYHSPSILSAATRRLMLKYGLREAPKKLTKGTAESILAQLPREGTLHSFLRVAGRTVGSGLEEGIEEVVEASTVTRGLNLAFGWDRPLTADTFGDFLLAQVPGGTLGATGAFRAEYRTYALRNQATAAAMNGVEAKAMVGKVNEKVQAGFVEISKTETAQADPKLAADSIDAEVRRAQADLYGVDPDELPKIEKVYVDADALVDAHGEAEAAAITATLLGVKDGAAALREARETGRRLEVPTAAYVDYLSKNPEHAEQVSERATIYEDGFTPQEVLQYQAEINAEKERILAQPDILAEGEESVEGEPSPASEEAQAAERSSPKEHAFVRAAKKYLKGRIPEGDMRAHVAMMRARVRAAARRAGVDPETIFGEFELAIRTTQTDVAGPDLLDPRVPLEERQKALENIRDKRVRGLFHRYQGLLQIVLTPTATRATFMHETGHMFFDLLEAQVERARRTLPKPGEVEGARQDVESARDARNTVQKELARTREKLEQTTDPSERAALESRVAEQESLLAQANAELEALTRTRDDLEVRAAQKQILLDYEAAKRWLNPEGGPLTDAHMEKWAEAWEAYLMRGKAPSPRLAAAFRRYQLLMTEVYGEAKNIFRNSEGAWVDENGEPVDAGLSEEIAAIFDRLLATEQELQLMQAALGDSSVFPTRRSMERALGREVTAEEWVEHLRNREKNQAKLARRTYHRILESQLQESERWYREKEARYRAEARDEYETLPARIIQLYLRGDLYDGESVVEREDGHIPLDHSAVVAAVGPELARRFITRKEGGVHPADVAFDTELYDTYEEMLWDVITLPSKNDWARERAKERMKQEHPDLLSDIDALRREIADILHTDDGMTTLLAEIRVLSSNVAGVNGEVRIHAHKELAKELADEKPLGKLNRQELDRIMEKERSLGDRALKASANGQGDLALNLKLQQLLNRYLYRFVKENAVKAASFQRDARRLTRRSIRQRVGRVTEAGESISNLETVGQVVGDAVDVLLESLGFTEPPPTQERERATVREALNRMAEFYGSEVGIDGELIGNVIAEGKTWEDLNLREMREIHNFFRSALNLTRASKTVIDGYSETYVDMDQAVADFVAEVTAESPLRSPLRTNPTLGDVIANYMQRAHASLVNPETLLLLASSGGIDVRSAAFRYVIGAMQNGKHAKDAWQRKLLEPLDKALQKITPEQRARWQTRIDSDALFPDHVRDKKPETVKDIFMLALYAGSTENLGVLQDGRGITPEQIRAAINEHLTKEDMDLVQEIWDIFNQTWEPSRDLHRLDTGVEPTKMEATPVITAYGTYRGGYFPAMYEWEAQARGDFAHDPTNMKELLGSDFIPVGTPHGRLKHRVPGFDGIVSTRLENLPRHAMQAAHDLGYRMAVKSVARFLLHPDVARVFNERIGHAHYRQMLQWVRDVGRAGYTGETVHTELFNRALRGMRANLSRAMLGYRPTTALADVQNILLPIASMGLNGGDVAAALGQFMQNPAQMYREVLEASPEVRVQVNAYRNAMRSLLMAMDRGWGPARTAVEKLNEHAFIFLETVQKGVVPIVYTAAYNQKLREETRAASEEAARVRESVGKMVEEAEGLRKRAAEAESDTERAKMEARAKLLEERAEKMTADANERVNNVPKTARLYAESMVRRSVPLHNLVDRSAFARSPTALGAQILFYSFFSTMYQQQAHIIDPFLKAMRRGEATTGDVMKMAVRMAAHAILANVLGEFLMARGPALHHGEDDKERYVAWAIQKALLAPILALPGGTDFAHLVESRLAGHRFGGSVGAASSALSALGQAYDAMVRDGYSVTAQRKFFAIARPIFVLSGLPVTPLASLEYLTSPSWDDYTMNVVEGLLVGRRNIDAPGSILTLGRIDRDPTGEREEAQKLEMQRLRNTPEAIAARARKQAEKAEKDARRAAQQAAARAERSRNQ